MCFLNSITRKSQGAWNPQVFANAKPVEYWFAISFGTRGPERNQRDLENLCHSLKQVRLWTKTYDYRNFTFQTARKHGMNLPDPYEIFSVSYGDNDDEVAKAFDYIQTQGEIYFYRYNFGQKY